MWRFERLWKGGAPIVIIAALYTVHFELEGLSNFCLTVIYGYPESALALPPLSIPRSGGYAWFAVGLGGSWLYAYALFSVLAVRRGLISAVLPLCFAVTALGAYYVNRTGVALSPSLMEAVFESNTVEAGEAVSWRLLLSIVFAVALAATLLAVFWHQLDSKRVEPGWTRAQRWGRGLFGAAVATYALWAPVEQPLAVYPFNLLRAAGTYVHERIAMQSLLAQRVDVSSAGIGWQDKPAQDLLVVVVLGESARADHFSINGYARSTTPKLARIPNLVSFSDAGACATLTRTAVPCLMTRATRATFDITLKEKSVISAFNRLGFSTAWLSINGVYGKYDNAISAVAKEAQLREFRGSIVPVGRLLYDGELLPAFDRFLATQHGNRFVVVHTMGSHWSYDRRYPKRYRRFVPTCDNVAIETCDRRALVNSYDNSILYADSVLARIIARLKPLNAVLLYVADHGQLLGEDGRYMHGQDRPEVLHVPMLWWASERFLLEHHASFARLAARRSNAVSHDFVFHSLLDCIGVSSPIIDPSLSLCSADEIAPRLELATSPPAD
ncbi:MAG: lipid A phosphoethanolamine transferase [Deltaproteobacteria bacterium]|nr:lipid A phosphoethanolamine transferase [Deltaproteobacteria bacterium]